MYRPRGVVLRSESFPDFWRSREIPREPLWASWRAPRRTASREDYLSPGYISARVSLLRRLRNIVSSRFPKFDAMLSTLRTYNQWSRCVDSFLCVARGWSNFGVCGAAVLYGVIIERSQAQSVFALPAKNGWICAFRMLSPSSEIFRFTHRTSQQLSNFVMT